MPFRLYLLPLVTEQGTGGPQRLPKYVKDLGIGWSLMDYGARPVALIRVDVTAGQHSALVANADVTAFPANLDNTVTAGNLATVRQELDAFRIPGQWVTTGMTFRQVARGVAQLFQLAQRLHGLLRDDVVPDGVELDTTVGDLPAPLRANLRTAAESLGFSTEGVTGAMTLRQALRSLASQWTGPLRLKGEEL